MPVTVFVAGIILGTERYQFNYAANLVMIAVGIAIASYGKQLPGSSSLPHLPHYITQNLPNHIRIHIAQNLPNYI